MAHVETQVEALVGKSVFSWEISTCPRALAKVVFHRPNGECIVKKNEIREVNTVLNGSAFLLQIVRTNGTPVMLYCSNLDLDSKNRRLLASKKFKNTIKSATTCIHFYSYAVE